MQLIAIVAIYLTTVYFFWKPEKSSHFVIAGQSLWIALISYGCSFLGALQVPAFILIMLYVGASIIYHLRTSDDSSSLVQNLLQLLDKSKFEQSIKTIAIKKQQMHSEVEDISLSETMDSVETIEEIGISRLPADDEVKDEESNLSNFYFKMLFYACLATFLYRNVWVFILAAIPLIMHLLYRLGNVTGFTSFVYNKIAEIFDSIKVRFNFF